MKKKILFIPLLATTFLFTPLVSVYADEETTSVEETTLVETEVNEENVTSETEETITFNDQLSDFCNKWLTPIISGVSGITGTLLAILIFVKKIKRKIEQHEEITQADVDEANAIVTNAKNELLEAKSALVSTTEQLQALKTDFLDLQESYAKAMESQKKEMTKTQLQLSFLRELVCKMVATNKDLIQNGYAKQIIQLCDETEIIALSKEENENIEEIQGGDEVNE